MSKQKQRSRYLSVAYNIALASPGAGGKKNRFRLGAVLVNKKQILSVRFNSLRTHPALIPFYEYPHLHAEANAILAAGLDNCVGGTLYIVRVKRDNSLGMAKPCPNCEKLIQYVGVKRVVYSTERGYYESR